jgi:hypothetical protein
MTAKTLTERLASATGIAVDDQDIAVRLRRLARSSRESLTLMRAAQRIETLAKHETAYRRAMARLTDYFEMRTAANMEKWTPESRVFVHKVLADLTEALAKTQEKTKGRGQ